MGEKDRVWVAGRVVAGGEVVTVRDGVSEGDPEADNDCPWIKLAQPKNSIELKGEGITPMVSALGHLQWMGRGLPGI